MAVPSVTIRAASHAARGRHAGEIGDSGSLHPAIVARGNAYAQLDMSRPGRVFIYYWP